MKTAGSTFRRRMVRELGAAQVFPSTELDPPEALPNLKVSYLTSVDAGRLRSVRAFAAHLPYFATELVPTPSLTLTILRHPVERTISYLKQHHRDRSLGPERTLESIYELPWHHSLHIKNYQARVFATEAHEGIDSVLTEVEMDPFRLARAKERIRSVDILGLQERFDEFVEEAVGRLGWRGNLIVQDQRRSEPVEVSKSFRRRIADDNAEDVELYEFACDLYEARRREARTRSPRGSPGR